MSKKNILVMCLADPGKNPRPNRIINLCAEHGYVVDVVSHKPKVKLPIRKVFEIKKKPENYLLKIIRFIYRLIIWFIPGGRVKNFSNNKYYGMSGLSNKLESEQYSLIIVEDLQILPLAFKIKKNAKILFDAREYYPLQNEESIIFNLFEKPERIRLCKTYLKDCNHVITVSNGLRDRYLKEFNVNSSVIRSMPYFRNINIFENNTGKIKLVYHGAANKNRQIEKLITVASELRDEFEMDLYLVGQEKYIKQLKMSVNNIDNVELKEPVEYAAIIPMLNQYDIGVCYFEPTTFNLKYSLPNKLFEYIQARIMVMIGPSPDMKIIIEQYGCGVVAKEFNIESMKNELKGISQDTLKQYKKQSDAASKELCFEVESKKISRILNCLLSNNPSEII